MFSAEVFGSERSVEAAGSAAPAADGADCPGRHGRSLSRFWKRRPNRGPPGLGRPQSVGGNSCQRGHLRITSSSPTFEKPAARAAWYVGRHSPPRCGSPAIDRHASRLRFRTPGIGQKAIKAFAMTGSKSFPPSHKNDLRLILNLRCVLTGQNEESLAARLDRAAIMG